MEWPDCRACTEAGPDRQRLAGCTEDAPSPVWQTKAGEMRARCPLAIAGEAGLDMGKMLLDAVREDRPMTGGGQFEQPRALLEATWYVTSEVARGD